MWWGMCFMYQCGLPSGTGPAQASATRAGSLSWAAMISAAIG